MADTASRVGNGPLAAHAHALRAAWGRIGEAVAALRGGDPVVNAGNATPFLWAFGHVVVAWRWLDQALLAGDRAFLAGRVHACRYFYECELPKIEAWLVRSDVAAMVPVEIF